MKILSALCLLALFPFTLSHAKASGFENNQQNPSQKDSILPSVHAANIQVPGVAAALAHHQSPEAEAALIPTANIQTLHQSPKAEAGSDENSISMQNLSAKNSDVPYLPIHLAKKVGTETIMSKNTDEDSAQSYVAQIESWMACAGLRKKVNKRYPNGLPLATADTMNHVEQAFGATLCPTVKAFLSVTYMYQMKRPVYIFATCLLDGETSIELVDEMTRLRREEHLPLHLLPFASNDMEIWCINIMENSTPISLYVNEGGDGMEDVTPDQHLSLKEWIMTQSKPYTF